MHKPENIVLVAIAGLLVPAFILWVGRQERLGRPAIIPNSVWRKTEFSSICVTVFLTWAMFNAFGYWCTLYLQELQGISAIQTSLRFLPLVVVGFLTNLAAGLLVDKVHAAVLVVVGCIFSAASPLLFAVLSPNWIYWAAAFPAMCFSPISSDLLFNVSNLVITATFASDGQALAGGVFNTVTQLGNSVGLAVTAVLASAVQKSAMERGETEDEARLTGYRAAFWLCFAAAVVSCFTASFGLRKSGKVGLKKD